MNRYRRFLVVIGAVLIQVCLGAIYSWSLYNQPLADKFGWEKGAIVMAYSIAIFVFAATTIVSGRLYDRVGPKIVAAIGGVLYGAGMVLSAFATELWQLYITYGVIAGMGVGFAYVSPLTTCVKWFPKHKGFITGIAVGAFGSGSMIFKNLIEAFLSGFGVSDTFIYLGIIFAALVLIGAALLKLPEAEGHQAVARGPFDHMTLSHMLKTKRFYYLWVMYLLASMPGLLVIGLAKDIGVDVVGLTTATAATAVTVIALFNAGGRLIWGTLSDRLGRVRMVVAMFVLTTLSLLVMAFIPLNTALYFICLIGIAFSFGGFLAVFPAITADFFGLKHLGANYGIIFQGYGVAAIVGPLVKSVAGGYGQTFFIAALFGALGLGLTVVLKRHMAVEGLRS